MNGTEYFTIFIILVATVAAYFTNKKGASKTTVYKRNNLGQFKHKAIVTKFGEKIGEIYL